MRCLPLNRHHALIVLSALVGGATLAVSSGSIAHARAVRSPAPEPAPAEASRDTLGPDALHLGRAAMEQSLGNLRGIVENLEAIDFSRPPSFPEADRAAFLLGQAYLQLGNVDRFRRLARAVSGWRLDSVYTQWLAYQLLLVETEAGGATADTAVAGTVAADSSARAALTDPVGLAAADALATSLLLRSGDAEGALRLIRRAEANEASNPVLLYMKAVALEANGADADEAWSRLASADTATALGRDLAGAASLRLATRLLERGEDPRAMLDRVPAASRYASRARHMHGLAAMERGDVAQGRATLEALLAADSSYAESREVTMALSGQALDEERWDDADRSYAKVQEGWTVHRDALARMLDQNAFDPLWASWQGNSPLSDALVLDVLPAQTLAGRLAGESARLATRPAMDVLPLETPPASAQLPWPVPPPPPAAWTEVSRSSRVLGEVSADLERSHWDVAREQERLADHRRYLGLGLVRLDREQAALRGHVAMLDSVRNTLESIDARLRAVRDAAKERIARRTAEILAACGRAALWMGAMRHFNLRGPGFERAAPAPDGYPGEGPLMTHEDSLLQAVRDFATGMAADAPGLIDRSYLNAWRPGLIARAESLGIEAERSLAWAGRMGVSIDSSIAAHAGSEALVAAIARVAALERASDSLRAAHEALRARVARQAVERAMATLEREREAIDYGLAASAYGLSVRLHRETPGDSASVDAGPLVVAGAEDASADTLHTAFDPTGGERPDDPETAALRGRAIERMRFFLAHHPESEARGEMRFRLADLLLVDARASFRDRMAEFLRRQSEGGAPGAVPVMDPSRALALYRTILAEDSTFEHRDAVLFNAGMLLADDGNAEAPAFFANLVTNHPESRYVQEAYLRMGDLHFNERRFAECVDLYRRAAAGADPSLQAIALYKLGWSHFNQEQFLDAADAFRSVLDVYGAHDDLTVDIEGESEEYLIHTLARAGGADAFAGYFDRIGARPYEMGVLLAMGQHFRHYSLYGEATATDSVAIRRYPLAPEALVSAQRLTETYQRWERMSLVRQAQLDCAPRFAPNSAWANAQTSDSVRSAGAAFARGSWQSVAVHHHLEARKGGAPADWRQALSLYETLLSYWPSDPESPNFELYAGEASERLGAYPGALAHYAAAAGAGVDSIARPAMLQRVAVTDAWYESTRSTPAAGGVALGSDSLARAVLARGDEMIARFPDHAAFDDVSWRQGNLAFAHGWYERAATDLGRLVQHDPKDSRAPMAAGLGAEALFRLERFEEAGAAFETALATAHAAGNDSLERRAEQAIPISYYRHAEAVAKRDSSNVERWAGLFEKVAMRWPRYEHAHLAQYRAGLGYIKAGMPRVAVRAMQALIDTFPRSEFVKDAHLQIAKTWESSNEPEKAADAYTIFANRYPEDPSAGDAWLKSADLYTAAKRHDKAEEVWLTYIRKFPDDKETAMEIMETLARRELAEIGPEEPVSTLLNPRPVGRGQRPEPPSHLTDYLVRAAANPDLASRDLLAQVRFLQGEEAKATYDSTRLTQPLEASIPVKQKLLDRLVAQYRQSVDLGVSTWANASAFRIGQSLVGFGEALEHSERPADLSGDDLAAYEDVILQQSQPFYDRGEGVWADLLRQKGVQASQDTWVAQARESLWKRLGDRFAFRPEFDFPLLSGEAPKTGDDSRGSGDTKASSSAGKPGPDVAHREGEKR
jgi:tetratricopeptide (TPR) repeat protein